MSMPLEDYAALFALPPPLPACFTCGRRLGLAQWRRGVRRCRVCSPLVGYHDRRRKVCRTCGGVLDPRRAWHMAFCPTHWRAYRHAQWLARKARAQVVS